MSAQLVLRSSNNDTRVLVTPLLGKRVNLRLPLAVGIDGDCTVDDSQVGKRLNRNVVARVVGEALVAAGGVIIRAPGLVTGCHLRDVVVKVGPHDAFICRR